VQSAYPGAKACNDEREERRCQERDIRQYIDRPSDDDGREHVWHPALAPRCSAVLDPVANLPTEAPAVAGGRSDNEVEVDQIQLNPRSIREKFQQREKAEP